MQPISATTNNTYHVKLLEKFIRPRRSLLNRQCSEIAGKNYERLVESSLLDLRMDIGHEEIDTNRQALR